MPIETQEMGRFTPQISTLWEWGMPDECERGSESDGAKHEEECVANDRHVAKVEGSLQTMATSSNDVCSDI